MKWSFVSLDAPKPKYLIANADEMEPGTFKDRILLECTPHQLLEGMIVAAFAIQADISYVYLRWAYKTAAHAITTAIEEAYEAGYLGKNILGQDTIWTCTSIRASADICVAKKLRLLNSLEGKRATPRAKPPFPQVSGLFGKPTIVNNVETFAVCPISLITVRIGSKS